MPLADTLARVKESVLALRVFGLEARIVSGPDAADAVAQQWEWCRPDAPSQRTIPVLPTPPHVLPTNSSSTGDDTTHEDDASAPLEVRRDDTGDDDAHVADYRLTASLTGLAIARRAGQYVMLHAGGVCDPVTGRVVGLVAASGTGKTTATRHFCSQGYGYVTDETLILNDIGDVLPYPKPLSVVLPETDRYGKTQHSPGELGLAEPPSGPLTLASLVLLERSTGESDVSADDALDAEGPQVAEAFIGLDDAPRLDRAPLLDALAQILPQSSAMPQIPGCLDLLARLVCAGGGVHRLRYREIASTDALLPVLFDLPPVEPFWRHVPGTWAHEYPDVSPYAPRPPATALALRPDAVPDDGTPDETEFDDAARRAGAPGADLRVRRAPFCDALVVDDDLEALVLVGSTPIHLMGLGTLVWGALDAPLAVPDLVAVCIDALGDRPDAEALVRASLDELVANHLVVAVQPDASAPSDDVVG